MFIIEFPVQPATLGSWYLRGTTSTGDIERAERFVDEEAARKALGDRKKWFKRASIKTARFISVDQ